MTKKKYEKLGVGKLNDAFIEHVWPGVLSILGLMCWVGLLIIFVESKGSIITNNLGISYGFGLIVLIITEILFIGGLILSNKEKVKLTIPALIIFKISCIFMSGIIGTIFIGIAKLYIKMLEIMPDISKILLGLIVFIIINIIIGKIINREK